MCKTIRRGDVPSIVYLLIPGRKPIPVRGSLFVNSLSLPEKQFDNFMRGYLPLTEKEAARLFPGEEYTKGL